MKNLKQFVKEQQHKSGKLGLIVPVFKLSMNLLLKYFSSSSKRTKFKKIKCEFYNKKYPDDIQHRLRNFKFRIKICCPNCGAFLDVGDF